MVVTGVIVLVSGVVLANYNQFGGKIKLQNLAYDVALSIREAQVYGISVAGFSVGTTNSYSTGYGVHFAANDPTHYELFADVNGNGIYNPSSGSDGNVPPSPYTISSGYKISRLCAPKGDDRETCTSVSSLDILFKRPESDAWISAERQSCILSSPYCQPSARIVLKSPRGDFMSVIVEDNGQISVSK